MEITAVGRSIERISKQRNLFVVFAILGLLSTTILSVRLATFDQRIVMVPGLQREMSVSNVSVSSSYLEETAMLFLSELLDISANDIQHKKDLMLKYTSHSDLAYSKSITEYFANAQEQYKKFDLSTHFTVKNMQIDQNKMFVVAHGVLTSWYGKSGHESKELSYCITFEYSGGFLRLKEFYNLVTDEKAEG